MEVHLGRAAKQLAQARRILQAGQLDKHPIGADALDRRLRHADLVDALAHDLQALLQGSVQPVLHAGFGESERDLVAGRIYVDVLGAGAEAHTCHRHRQSLQRFTGLGALCVIVDGNHHRIVAEPGRARQDLFLAQHLAHLVEKRAKPVFSQRRSIHLQNQM